MMSMLETIEGRRPALTSQRPDARHRHALRYEHADRSPADPLEGSEADVLAVAPVERNVFAEPWMLQAAGAHLAGSKRVSVLLSREGTQVTGVLPVVLPKRIVGLPIADVWTHLHNFDTTPLVRVGHAERFLDDLFIWLRRHNVAVLRWPRVALEGPFGRAMFAYLERTGRVARVAARRERPLLLADVAGGAPDLDRLLSSKRRREFQRCRRRLGELGDLTFRRMDERAECDSWLAEFLRLEASGWKGEGGRATALACRAEERAYFAHVFHEAARRGQLIAYGLELDGRPIAMTVNYLAGDGVWAYKTAYDEMLAKFAPGVVVEVEGTLALIRDERVAWVDSCSDSGNALIREIWRDRRVFGDVIIAVRPGKSLAVPAVMAGERAYRGMREQAKKAYHQLQDRRRRK